MARRFQNIGYGILATQGTAAFFESHGLKAQLVGKIGDDEHDIPSYVRKGKIQAIINTVGTKRTADEDGEQIRRSASRTWCTTLTALDTADAMLKVLESRSFVTEAI